MKRVIELTTNNIARLDNVEPCLLPDGLELEFKSYYDLSNAFVSLRNGVVKGQYKLTSPFRIDDKFLFGGNLDIGITAYHNGEKVKQWFVLPIRLKESDFEIEAFEYLAELENKLDLALERIEKLENQHKIIK